MAEAWWKGCTGSVLTGKGVSGCAAVQVNRLRWRAGKKIANGVDSVDEAESQTSYELRTGMRWQRHDSTGFVVELQPLEIRTFLLTAATEKAQHSQKYTSAAAAAA